MHTCIILFCIIALFEAAFLGLTIPTWDTQGLIAYLALALLLQIGACVKALCIWRIHRYQVKSIVYIACAVISGSIMYLNIKLFSYLSTVSASVTPIPMVGAIAVIDALLSVLLLYGLKNWLTIILNSEPLYLSSQIRHHFLFNTLNTTVCRIDENPRQAQDILVKLAELFRKILFLKVYISLEEELASVKCYIEIEKYRLGERLQVRWLLNYDTDNVIKVPALILQPLVENAIYYGIERIMGGGSIIISLNSIGNRLIIQVCNPIDNLRCCDLPSGNNIAQSNIALRLALIYGHDFSFEREQCDKEYRATINIPKEGNYKGDLLC